VAPFRLNVLLTALALAATVLQFTIVPIFVLPYSPVLAAVFIVLVALSTPLNRALLHEAIHGRLARGRIWNERLGRALAVTSGIAFDAIRFGHLAHHQFPRHGLDRADVIEPGTNRFVAWLSFYAGLLGLIHVREILAVAVVVLPRRAIIALTDWALAHDDSLSVLHGRVRRSLARRLWRARTDLMSVTLIYAGAFYLYGTDWPVLLAAIAARAVILSVQDNVAHYGTPPVLGAPALNMNASRWFSRLMLNQNLHGMHHVRPELPWNKLPEALDANGKDIAGNYLALALAQFHGPKQRIETVTDDVAPTAGMTATNAPAVLTS
jgi:fatty acid desaturase